MDSIKCSRVEAGPEDDSCLLYTSFQKFIPAKGLFGDQKWIGLDNFTYLINMPGAMSALRNTVVIAFFKIVLGLVVPITVAILLKMCIRDR